MSTSSPVQLQDSERLERRRVTTVITILAIAAFAAILNETSLSVATPHLMAEFSIPAVSAQWLTTGFLLTMAVVIPTTGFLIQRFTTRQLFIAAMGLFIGGILLAMLAPDFPVMLAARVIQAAGTAIILPLLMTTTLTSVAPSRRGAVMGINSVVISVAPAIGPTVAGAIMNTQSWRMVFAMLLGVGVVVLVAGLVFVRSHGETRRVPLDVPSVLISAVAFSGLVYGLSTLETVLQGVWTAVIALVIGLAALAVFVRRQRLLMETGSPLVDLRPFRSHNFRVSVGIMMVAMGTMLGTVVVLPIFLQDSLGLSVLTTGLMLLPGGLAQGVASPIIGRIYDRVGPRPLVIPGAVLLAATQWLLSTVGTETPVPLIIVLHVLFSIGMALLLTPLMTAALGDLPRELYGHGSAILNTLQQLGGAAGTALLVAALSIGTVSAAQRGADGQAALAVGTQHAFIAGGIVALLGVALSLRIRKPAPPA
jgi:DHA2 family lincomycin resistance protein-like MFS transporter